jgi:hypothetical protein
MMDAAAPDVRAPQARRGRAKSAPVLNVECFVAASSQQSMETVSAPEYAGIAMHDGAPPVARRTVRADTA